jgi:hypothetical protein
LCAFDSPLSSDDLVFLHHSCGANWLDSGLDAALTAKPYIDERNDITYGTVLAPDAGRPASLGGTPGDQTDMRHWLPWFNDYFESIRTHGCANGVNRIVMFKSCYPTSNISSDGSEPGDPFSPEQTLANYRAVFRHPSGSGSTYTHNGYPYQALGDLFADHPDTIFVIVTAPPLHYGPTDATTDANAARARTFNQWLKTDWLNAYRQAHPQHRNVVVYDWFDLLAHPASHPDHPNRLRDEFGGGGGDSHPNAAANTHSTRSFALDPSNFLDQAWQAFTRPSGRLVEVNNANELRAAIADLQDHDTLLLADGNYQNGSPLILNNADHVTLRSASGDASRVILRGRSSFSTGGNYDELDDILRVRNCNNLHVEHLRFEEAHGYGIKLELDGTANPNGIHISDCHFRNIGTRHIKGTRDPGDDQKRIREGSVRNCRFENTVTPPATGGWHADGDYVAGIDAMCLADWVFEDNEFRGIRGRNAVGRSAIFIWHHSENLLIRRNRILNCDRGITLGLSGDISGYHVNQALVCNNMISLRSGDGLSSDSGIECWTVNEVKIYHNTIWRHENPNGRGIRFIANIHNTEMVNNLVRGRLVFDGGLSISRNENNLSGDLPLSTFVHPASCDLRLTASASNALDGGLILAEVPEDFSGNPRDLTPDLGAWEGVSPSEVDNSPPLAPQGLSGNAFGAHRIDLSWDASSDPGQNAIPPSGVGSYRIYRDGELAASTTATHYSDTALDPASSYTYTVSALDLAGNESPGSNPVELTTEALGNSVHDLRARHVPTLDAAMKATLRQVRKRGITLERDEGVLGQWGDSITHSQAYLGALASYGMVDISPSNGHDYEPILLWMGASPGSADNPLYHFKGGSHCNDSGWRITNALGALSGAISRVNPSWSLTMYGTNDIRNDQWNATRYGILLARFIEANVQAGIVPVLSTIPPCVGYEARVMEANTTIKAVGTALNIPVVDLYALYLELHPDDWASVLLGDGVHPSHTYGSGDLSDDALRDDGYNIRNILTLDIAEKIRSIIFDNATAEGGESAPLVTVHSPSHPYLTHQANLQAQFEIEHDSGPAPEGFSWVLDLQPRTEPDTTQDGTQNTLSLEIPAAGIWYFHVRARNGSNWGPTVHLPVIATANPTFALRRSGYPALSVADTLISVNWGGDDNFGASPVLNTYNGGSARESRALFRFDLTDLPAQGLSAAWLVIHLQLPLTQSFRWELFSILNAWQEGTGNGNNDQSGVMWNNAPAYAETPTRSGTLAPGDAHLQTEVTDHVRAWLQGSQSNHGFMLQHLEIWRALEPITSEYGAETLRPMLLLEYAAPSNHAPVLSPIGNRSVRANQSIQFQIQAGDPDDDPLEYSASTPE